MKHWKDRMLDFFRVPWTQHTGEGVTCQWNGRGQSTGVAAPTCGVSVRNGQVCPGRLFGSASPHIKRSQLVDFNVSVQRRWSQAGLELLKTHRMFLWKHVRIFRSEKWKHLLRTELMNFSLNLRMVWSNQEKEELNEDVFVAEDVEDQDSGRASHTVCFTVCPYWWGFLFI